MINPPDFYSQTCAESGLSEKYHFRLFVAGDEPNSLIAKKNLDKICKIKLNGRCKVEIIDVLYNFEAALKDNIIVTPTLLMIAPEPRVRVVGNLNDSATIHAALRLIEG